MAQAVRRVRLVQFQRSRPARKDVLASARRQVLACRLPWKYPLAIPSPVLHGLEQRLRFGKHRDLLQRDHLDLVPLRVLRPLLQRRDLHAVVGKVKVLRPEDDTLPDAESAIEQRAEEIVVAQRPRLAGGRQQQRHLLGGDVFRALALSTPLRRHRGPPAAAEHPASRAGCPCSPAAGAPTRRER